MNKRTKGSKNNPANLLGVTVEQIRSHIYYDMHTKCIQSAKDRKRHNTKEKDIIQKKRT